MGACTSRKVLLESSERSEGQRDPGREIQSFSSSNRLVRNELRQVVQHNVRNKIKQARNSLSLVQVASKSVQQEDV